MFLAFNRIILYILCSAAVCGTAAYIVIKILYLIIKYDFITNFRLNKFIN